MSDPKTANQDSPGDLVFAEESVGSRSFPAPAFKPGPVPAWKVLIVDDDEEIHSLTRLVLRGYTFENRNLELLSGFTGEEAKALMAEHPDVAVILMDVVMEHDEAGLEAARFIREELENRFVRIILRTGQPGQAPEQQVIQDYDINDYKDKVRLTTQRLMTSLTASLRSYRDLRTIDATRRGMERIVAATGDLFEARSLGRLAKGILHHCVDLLDIGFGSNHGKRGVGGDPELVVSGLAGILEEGRFIVYSGIGVFHDHIGQPVEGLLDQEALGGLARAAAGDTLFFENHFLARCQTRTGLDNLIYIQAPRELKELDRDLLRTFSVNISLAFENLGLNREITNTQKDVTFTLGEVIEVRSNEAGNHVRRVAESSRLLGMLAGLDEDAVELLWLASPMHDLGKIGIPDQVLNKPGKLTAEEWGVMQSHTEIGRQILKNSDRPILRTGSLIAHQHHENWDGSGYPSGLKAEAIHVFARITKVIDVFDALYHKRCYKEAWALDRILSLLREERGRQFDPALTDLFLDNLSDFLDIQKAFEE